jgi:RNA polymerase sigma-70 factor, ECF subfamily
MAITREKILEIARSLPPAPRVFSELDQLLRESETERGLDEIAALIKRDSALAAQLLRISNSVVFGGEQPTGSIEEAVARVGLQVIFRLVSEVAVARLTDRPLTHYGIEAEAVREHMLRSAFVCEQLALECGLDARHAYTAGLMRPLGLLVLDRVADSYEHAQDYHPAHDDDYLAWEGRIFGVASCEVAAMVLTEWSFPSGIVEGVRNQYLLRSADLTHSLACLVNLSGGVVADDGHALLGETRHWGPTPWKLDAVGLTEFSFHAAVARARTAYAEFQRRVHGDQRAGGVDMPAAEGRRQARSEVEATPADAAPGGAMSVDSCNFPLRVRVVHANDEPPVHTPEPGVSPANDFTTFMRNYQDMVFSTAARLTGNDAQAEDISQEVFLKAYENYDHLSTSPTVGGWLKTVATNLSLNHLSRYRNRWRFFSEFRRAEDADDRDAPEVEFAAPDTFFAGVDAADRRAIVDQALSQLPEHQRVPLVLYHFEDMPYDDIAKKLRVSLAKVKTDILRARAALARILTRSGTAHEKISL